MHEEKISLVFEAPGASKFTKDVQSTEKALRQEAKALDQSARSLQARVLELRKSDKPDKQLIRNLQLQAQAARLNSSALKAQSASLKEHARETEKAASNSKGLAGSLANIGATLRGGGVVAAILAAVAAVGALGVNALKASDEYNTLQSRIKNATKATGDYIGVSNELNRISQQTGTSLEANVDLFQRLKISADAVGASNKDIVRFTESVAKLGVISGSSSAKIADTTMQLAQMFSQPKIQAEELNSVLDGMPEVAARIEKGLGLLPGSLKNAVKEGKVLSKDVLKAILAQSEDIDKEFSTFPKSLQRSMTSLEGAFARFSNTADKTLGISQILSTVIEGMANAFNFLSDSISGAALQLGEFLKKTGMGKLNVSGIAGAAIGGPLGGLIGQLRNVTADDLTNFGQNKGNVSDKRGPGFTPPPKTKKTKDKTGQIERNKISEITDKLSNALQDIDLEFETRTLQLGAFATEADKVSLEIAKTASKSIVLKRIAEELLRLNLKSAEGAKEREEALTDVRHDLKKSSNELLAFRNQLDKTAGEEGAAAFKRGQEIRFAAIEQIKDREIAAGDELLEGLQQQYEERRISIDEYYKQQQSLLDGELEAEEKASKDRITLLKAEIKEARKLNDKAQEEEIKKSIELEEKKLEDVSDSIRQRKDKLKQLEKEEVNQAAKTFGDGFQQAIESAIEEAFAGDGVLTALKGFANNMRKLIAGTLAQAVAEGFRNSKLFQGISNFFGGLFNRIAGRTSGGQASATGGGVGQGLNISGLTKGKAGLALLGTAAVAGGQYLSGKKGVGASLAGTGLSAAGGALSGAMIGSMIMPGIGTAAGALIGGIAGGASSISKNAKAGGFWSSKAGIATAFALGGPLGFIALAAGKKRKAAERAQYQENVLAPALNALVSSADPNNLMDLRAKKYQAARGMKGRGSNGMRLKQDAMNQIQALIDAREKSIAEAIETLKQQNEEIRQSFALADAKPFEKAALERQFAIKQIEFETKKLLEQFKDSEEAKTLILEQEALKREQLNRQEQESAKQSVLDLEELLKQRDEIANSNVFTRAQSKEQIKAAQLQSVDKQIAEQFQFYKGLLATGVDISKIPGAGALASKAGMLNNIQLSVVINESTDSQQTQEMINRAFDNFAKKVYGATA